GEPFTFGVDAAEDLMQSAGLRALEIVPSDVCLRGRKDPVYSIYKFCVAAADKGPQAALPTTFRETRFDRGNRMPARPHAPSANGPTRRSSAPKRAPNADTRRP